jgi:hypothetical protein
MEAGARGEEAGCARLEEGGAGTCAVAMGDRKEGARLWRWSSRELRAACWEKQRNERAREGRYMADDGNIRGRRWP